MEELKLLVQMVASLPAMAMWVIAFFFVYKVVVVGSIYGLIRFAIDKAHNWLTTAKDRIEKVETLPMIRGMTIDSELEYFIGQISRIRGKAVSVHSTYVHRQSVDWLKEAIDAKEADDFAKAEAKKPRAA